MDSSAFEVILIPLLQWMVYGIVMGMAMLAVRGGFHLPRGTDTGGSNLEQSRRIVSGPLPNHDGTW